MGLISHHQWSLPGGQNILITTASLLPIMSVAAKFCHLASGTPGSHHPTEIREPASPAESPTPHLAKEESPCRASQCCGAPRLMYFSMPQGRENHLALSGNGVGWWEEGVGRRHVISALQHSYLSELWDSFLYITPAIFGISTSWNICSHWFPVVPRILNPLAPSYNCWFPHLIPRYFKSVNLKWGPEIYPKKPSDSKQVIRRTMRDMHLKA